ncbi:MAG TPA: DUF4870 domain-containing protein [Euzebyales bacterium]
MAVYRGGMENMRHETRPCAHCGGIIAPDDTTCATCGRPYIPDASATDDASSPAADGTASADVPPPPSDVAMSSAPPPPAAAITDESRMWAMGAHLSALAGVLLGGLPAFLGPLVVWLLRRDEHDPFAAAHAREALNFNISVIMYAVVGVLVTILTLGLALLIVVPVGIILFILYLVVTVRGAIAASRSEYYDYPLTIRLVR